MPNARTNNDHLRSLLSKPLDELQLLEDNSELILSFSQGICQLIQKNGGALPLLQEISTYKINRESDPFCNHASGLFDYFNATTFFKISHQQNTGYIDIGLYSEINAMRQRNYEWFALSAVIDF